MEVSSTVCVVFLSFKLWSYPYVISSLSVIDELSSYVISSRDVNYGLCSKVISSLYINYGLSSYVISSLDVNCRFSSYVISNIYFTLYSESSKLIFINNCVSDCRFIDAPITTLCLLGDHMDVIVSHVSLFMLLFLFYRHLCSIVGGTVPLMSFS